MKHLKACEIVMKKIVFRVPGSHKELVKEAMFKAGAGQGKNYECCSWEVEGTGQFKPSKEAKPYVGEKEKINRLPEFRVEMICNDEKLLDVIQTLRLYHPYEEPAFEVFDLYSLYSGNELEYDVDLELSKYRIERDFFLNARARKKRKKQTNETKKEDSDADED